MQTADPIPYENTFRQKIDTRRVAWVVILMSALVFTLICGVVTYGLQFFFFQSTIQMSSAVKVARGSVGITGTDFIERFEPVGRDISRSTTVRTDVQSQATVDFRDTGDQNRIVLSVTSKEGAEFMLRNATQPRFEWSQRPYYIELEAATGEWDVLIPFNLESEISVVFRFDDVFVELSGSGRYTIANSADTVVLQTYEGQGAIIPDHRVQSRSVVSGQRGVYDRRLAETQVSVGYIDLLANSLFQEPPFTSTLGESSPDSGLSLVKWNCSNVGDDGILGSFNWEVLDGRRTVRLLRGDGTTNHGETRCVQFFGPDAQKGLIVDGFDYLSLRTSFYIEDHSVNLCGVAGSECALMLRMEYVDITGEPHIWYQGFYSVLETTTGYPATCNSCQQEHRRIRPATWYTYESGNLFSQLPPERRPAFILNVHFYASGHEYDVFASEVSLLAGTAALTDELEE